MLTQRKVEINDAHLSECIEALFVGRYFECCLAEGIVSNVKRDERGNLSFDFWSHRPENLEEFFTCLVSPYSLSNAFDISQIDSKLPPSARREKSVPLKQSAVDYMRIVGRDFDDGKFDMVCDFSVWTSLFHKRLVQKEAPEFRDFRRLVIGMRILSTERLGELKAGTKWQLQYYPSHAIRAISGFIPFDNVADLVFDAGRAMALPFTVDNARVSEFESIRGVLSNARLSEALELAKMDGTPYSGFISAFRLVKKIRFNFWSE